MVNTINCHWYESGLINDFIYYGGVVYWHISRDFRALL